MPAPAARSSGERSGDGEKPLRLPLWLHLREDTGVLGILTGALARGGSRDLTADVAFEDDDGGGSSSSESLEM